MHTYYYSGELTDSITLSKDESNHAIKVMRSSEGDEVLLINGQGEKAKAKIVVAHPKKCELEVIEVLSEPSTNPKICIAIAPTKSNDRIEFFLEKATEIGVDEIVPLICKNNERDRINLERWHKVVLAAVKQSKRFWMPLIHEPIKLKDYVSYQFENTIKMIAYCEDLPEKHISAVSSKQNDKNRLLLIGPEGDFTNEEVVLAEQNGFVRVNLGVNRLRTETAGIVAVTLLKNQ